MRKYKEQLAALIKGQTSIKLITTYYKDVREIAPGVYGIPYGDDHQNLLAGAKGVKHVDLSEFTFADEANFSGALVNMPDLESVDFGTKPRKYRHKLKIADTFNACPKLKEVDMSMFDIGEIIMDSTFGPEVEVIKLPRFSYACSGFSDHTEPTAIWYAAKRVEFQPGTTIRHNLEDFFYLPATRQFTPDDYKTHFVIPEDVFSRMERCQYQFLSDDAIIEIV